MKKKYFITGFIIILGILVLSKVSINSNKDLAVYIENELNSSIPASNENLYVNKIDCDNNVNAYWDNDKWGLFISNFSKKTKCNLYFIHDTEKPYWQMESVEKVNVLSTDILEFKIAGTDSLGNVSSNLDISNLSFYVNDELESPIKVELTKLEELNKKIIYFIKVHMVGGAGNLKVKISSSTLTDTSNNQNDEITLDTGIVVSKNPAKIFLYSDSRHAGRVLNEHIQILKNKYKKVENSSDLSAFNETDYDLIIFDFDGWSVPIEVNNLSNINIISYGNDTNSSIKIIESSTESKSGVGKSKLIAKNSLTNYLDETIPGDGDFQNLIKFSNNVTVLYQNETNNITYDSIGYFRNNDYTWFHYQLYGLLDNQNLIIPIIQFTLGELK